MLSAYQIESLQHYQRVMARTLLNEFSFDVSQYSTVPYEWFHPESNCSALRAHALWRGIGYILAGETKLALRDSWLVAQYPGGGVAVSDAWRFYKDAIETLLLNDR